MAREHGLPLAEDVLEPRLQQLAQQASSGGGGSAWDAGTPGSAATSGASTRSRSRSRSGSPPRRLPRSPARRAAGGLAGVQGSPLSFSHLQLLQQSGGSPAAADEEAGTPTSSFQMVERGDSVSSAAFLALNALGSDSEAEAEVVEVRPEAPADPQITGVAAGVDRSDSAGARMDLRIAVPAVASLQQVMTPSQAAAASAVAAAVASGAPHQPAQQQQQGDAVTAAVAVATGRAINRGRGPSSPFATNYNFTGLG
jgi:hypothetical protein